MSSVRHKRKFYVAFNMNYDTIQVENKPNLNQCDVIVSAEMLSNTLCFGVSDTA
jgi:hypothetical protein